MYDVCMCIYIHTYIHVYSTGYYTHTHTHTWAGEFIDATMGVTFGLSTLTAAGFGFFFLTFQLYLLVIKKILFHFNFF